MTFKDPIDHRNFALILHSGKTSAWMIHKMLPCIENQGDAKHMNIFLIQLTNAKTMKCIVLTKPNVCPISTNVKLDCILAMRSNVKITACSIVLNQTNAYGKIGYVMDLSNAFKEMMKTLTFAIQGEALLKEPLLNVPKPNDLDTM